MQLLKWFGWLPGGFYAVVGGCQGVAMEPLECCSLLPGCCYAATKVFCVVDRGFLCSC